MKYSLFLHKRKKNETLGNYINSLKIHLMCMLQQRHLLLRTSHLLRFSYIIVISFFKWLALLENFPIKIDCYELSFLCRKKTVKYARQEDYNAPKFKHVFKHFGGWLKC